MKMFEKKNFSYAVEILIIEFIVAIANLLIIIKATPFTDLMDEFSMCLIPATLAGLNWSEVAAYAEYYGFGYFFLFYPLFKSGIRFIWIYRIMLFGISLLDMATVCVCWRLFTKHYPLSSSSLRVFVCLCCNFIVCTPPYNLNNEHMIKLIIWLCILLICELIWCEEKNKKKIIYSSLLGILLAYSLTIHSRNIVLIAAVFLTAIIYGIIYKKYLLGWLFYFFIGSGYMITRLLKNTMKLYLLGNSPLADHNEATNVLSSSEFSVKYIISGLKLLAANFGTIAYFSSIVGVFLMIVLVSSFFRTYHSEGLSKIRVYFPVFVFPLIGFAITILGLLFMQMRNIYIADANMDTDSYVYKYYMYLRYYVVFVTPLMVFGIYAFVKGKYDTAKNNIMFFAGVVCVFAFYFIAVPKISGQYYGVNSFYSFSWKVGLDSANKLDLQDYAAITLLTFMMGMIFYFLLRNNRQKLILIFFILCMGAQYIYFPSHFSENISNKNYKSVDAALGVIDDLDNDWDVYVYDDKGLTPYLIQAYEYQSTIHVGIPDDGEYNKTIIFSSLKLPELSGYQEEKIDDNEMMYIYRGDS